MTMVAYCQVQRSSIKGGNRFSRRFLCAVTATNTPSREYTILISTFLVYLIVYKSGVELERNYVALGASSTELQ